jgi:hypothetical protein
MRARLIHLPDKQAGVWQMWILSAARRHPAAGNAVAAVSE